MARPVERLERPARTAGATTGALGWRVEQALDRLGVAEGEPFLVMAVERDSARARASDPSTSHAAAASIDDLPTRQREVLDVFHRWQGGMTDVQLVERYDAVARLSSKRRQSPSGVRSRRAELVTQGFLRDSHRKRKLPSGRQAIVWELTPKGGGSR